MITQNTNMHSTDKLQLLIDYNFNFSKLINVYDNVKHRNGLIQLCKYSPNYEFVKMLFNHCKTLSKCKIDIKHCDVNRKNALGYAALNDINTFKYFLSNKCFPNHDEIDDKNVEIALNQKDIHGSTVAHDAANNPKPHIVDTFKLLKQYNFNFNIYNNYGRLSIHNACRRNCASLLSWMIDENIFDDINCKTKYSRKKKWNDQTPLYISVKCNGVECVDVLCKQSSSKNVEITQRDVYCALKKDTVLILKLLLCRIFLECKISNMNDILKQEEKSIISFSSIKSMIQHCNTKCLKFLNDLFCKGYSCNNFSFIVFHLDCDLKTVINDVAGANNIGDDEDDIKMCDDYEILSCLGEGTFGLVELGKDKKTGNKMAIKHIKNGLSNKISIQFLTSEIESLKKLSTHKNIINLLNYQICSSGKVLLYFEYCSFGDLSKLLSQCDYFSLRISFKYFLQLLSAISTCHSMDIVHRDLKLSNILISDTFQLKVCDFGLASIVGDQIYNVGTKNYQSPELIEAYTSSSYDINHIIVLKSCDVFSLAIIFWQMMNGIEYFPFKCYKHDGINYGNYGLIKRKKFDIFWKLHSKCHMMNECGSQHILLLQNLFEEMFEYNPHKRISISSILQHKFVELNENDLLFHMNDLQLEAFVRDKYHQTKNEKNKHTKAPKTYDNYSTRSLSNNNNIPGDMDEKTSGLKISHYLLQDSSDHQVNANSSKVYFDQNKVIYSFAPIVVMIGIESNENSNDNKSNILLDYINVKQMLHDVKHFDCIYHNKKHQMVHLTNNNNNNNDNNIDISNEFALKWSIKDIDKFNSQIFQIIQNDQFNYDCLIYFLSSYKSQSKIHFYDSYKKKYSFHNKIFEKFNNRKCEQLAKKAKIFVTQSYNDNNENEYKQIEYKRIEHENVDFMNQYYRIVYSPNNNVGVLINSFCVSLCKNINDENDIDDNIRDLNDIIFEIGSRMNNKYFDDNYIPSRCKIVFTSFKPLHSTIHYDPIVETVVESKQQDIDVDDDSIRRKTMNQSHE